MNTKKILCFVSDQKYFVQTKHAIMSAKKHNPDYKIALLSDGIEDEIIDINIRFDELKLDKNFWILTGRPAILKYCIENLNYDNAILLDGDTYTFNKYEEVEKEFEAGASIIVFPHLLAPLPNDNLNPKLNLIGVMGNYNAGMVCFSKKGINFLNWLYEQTIAIPHINPSNGLAAEQGWLRYAADFDENTKILRHPGYNVAYWNLGQRQLNFNDGVWTVNNQKLVLMHFSGLKKDLPTESMSIHQNRYLLNKSGFTYKMFDEYKKIVWG